MIEQLEDCLLFKTRVIEYKLNQIAKDYFNKFGYHMTYAYILKAVYFKKEINPKQLAEEIYIIPSTVTRMVDKLIEDGLVSQGNEKSKKVIYLTKKGNDLMPSLLEAWENYHHAIKEEFGEEEVQSLSKSMSNLM